MVHDYYSLLTFRGVCWEPAEMIWDKTIPRRWQIFLWLAFKGRLNVRTFMLRKQWKNIEHPYCDSSPAEETVDHIILRCAPAHFLWSKLEVLQHATESHSLIDFVRAL
ncbi:hypothetical protein VPH35_037027 [Triticum aestivum]